MKIGRSRLLTNALANYAGQITSVAVGLLLTPVLIAALGNALYGVLTLIMAVQSFGGLLDFGVTPGVVRYVAAHHAREEWDEINRVVSSSLFLLALVGMLAFALTIIVAWAGLPLLRLTRDQLGVARQALVIAGASLMVALPLGVLGTLLVGFRQYEKSNAVGIAATLVTAAGTLLVLRLHGGPTVLVAVNGLSLVTVHAVKAALVFRLMPRLRLGYRLISRPTLRRIGSYSLWLFLLDAATKAFYNADAVLIAAFLPVGAVTAYYLGFKLANALSYLSGPFVAVLFPAAAELDAQGDTRRLQRLLIHSTRLTVLVTVPAVLWLLTFGGQALDVWVGPSHRDALPVLYVFLAVFLVSTAQNPASTIMRGIGRARTLALVVVIEYLANGLISVLLIPRIGVVGAALGTLIPVLVNALFIIPWIACRDLQVSYLRFTVQVFGGPAVAAAPALGLLWLVRGWLAVPSLLSLAANGALTVLLFSLFYAPFVIAGADKEVVEQILHALRAQRFYRKETP